MLYAAVVCLYVVCCCCCNCMLLCDVCCCMLYAAVQCTAVCSMLSNEGAPVSEVGARLVVLRCCLVQAHKMNEQWLWGIIRSTEAEDLMRLKNLMDSKGTLQCDSTTGLLPPPLQNYNARTIT